MIGYVPMERRRKSKPAEVRDGNGKGSERERVWMKGSNNFGSISFADPIPLGLDYAVIPVPK